MISVGYRMIRDFNIIDSAIRQYVTDILKRYTYYDTERLIVSIRSLVLTDDESKRYNDNNIYNYLKACDCFRIFNGSICLTAG